MTTRMSLFTVALVLWSSYVAHGQLTYRTLLPLNYTAEDAPIVNGTRVLRSASTLEECVGDNTYHMFEITIITRGDIPTYDCVSLTLNGNGDPLQLDSNIVINDNLPSSLSNPDFALSQILPPVIAGRDGLDQAYSFDGVRQYLNLGNLRSTCMGNPERCDNGVTYSFWMKITNEQNRPTTNKYQFISSGAQSPDSFGFNCYSRDGDIRWAVRAHKKVWWIGRVINMNVGTWQHMIATWHKDLGLGVYRNGELIRKVGVGWTYNPPTDVTINDFVLGRSSSFPEPTNQYAEFTLQDFEVFYITFLDQTAARGLYKSYFPDFDLANPNFLPRRTVGFTGRQAFAFDGRDTILSLGNNRESCFGNLGLCSNGVTFSLWLKLTNELGKSSVDHSFVLSGGGQATKSHGVALYTRFNRLLWWFHLPDGRMWGNWYEDYGESFPVTMNHWTHLIATWKADQGLFLYDNGAWVTHVGQSVYHNPDTKYNDFIIGQKNDDIDYGAETHGEFTLEDFRVFYRFVSQYEAKKLFLQRISEPNINPLGLSLTV